MRRAASRNYHPRGELRQGNRDRSSKGAIAARRPPWRQHQHHSGRRLECSLDHRQLALIEFEVNYFPRLRFLVSQMLLNFPLESFFWKLDSLVQPGCTVKPVTVLLALGFPNLFCCLGLYHFAASRGECGEEVARGLPSGSKLCAWILESVSSGNHRMSSSFRVSNTDQLALLTGIHRILPTWWASCC